MGERGGGGGGGALVVWAEVLGRPSRGGWMKKLFRERAASSQKES